MSLTPTLEPNGTSFDYDLPDLRMICGDLVYVTGPYRFFGEAAVLEYDDVHDFGPRDEISGVLGLEYELTAQLRVVGQRCTGASTPPTARRSPRRSCLRTTPPTVSSATARLAAA